MIGTFTQFAWTLFCLIWLTKVVENLKNPKITKKTKYHAFFMCVSQQNPIGTSTENLRLGRIRQDRLNFKILIYEIKKVYYL